jgi:hypothetical protein
MDDIAVLNRKENRAIAKKFKADLYQKYKLKDKEELKWFFKLRIICDREARKI